MQQIGRALAASETQTASESLEQANREIRALKKTLVAVPPSVGAEDLGLVSVLAEKIETLARMALELMGGTPPAF